LNAFVYSIAALAAFVFLFAASQTDSQSYAGWQPILLVLLVLALHRTNIVTRIRATLHGIAPTSLAVLVCITYASPAAAVLYTGIGTLAAKLLARQRPIKAIFNASSETLAAAAAGAAAYGVGLIPVSQTESTGRVTATDILAICAAAGAYALVDEVLMARVVSLAGGLRMRQILMSNVDVRYGIRFGGQKF